MAYEAILAGVHTLLQQETGEHCPPDPTEPDTQTPRGTHGSVAAGVPGRWMDPKGALDEQPHRRGGLPILHNLIRLRAHSYVSGPVVPSDMVRRYQNVGGSV
jgi:hypothetical protein